MKHPFIKTKHSIIKLLEVNQSQLLCDYYISNKNNFKAWEPKRDASFYLPEFWELQVKESLELFNMKQAVRLVALDQSQTHVIATCNFSNIVWGCFLACHMGYSINKSYEGQGIMLEIAQAGINYIHKEFKLHRIMANHRPTNIRSAKLLSRLGFDKEGFAKNYLKINGQWRDHVLNSLILPTE